MKKLKHLLLVLVCVTLAAFAMTGCEKTSSQKEDEAQSEIEAQNIKDVTSFTKNFANLMTKYTYEDFETAQESGNTIVSVTFDNDWGVRWKQFVDEYGEVASAKVLDATKSDGLYSDQIILSNSSNADEGNQMILTIKYNDQLTAVSTTIGEYSDDSKETVGSKMETAGINTATGLIVVFLILVFLSLVIYCFRFIGGSEKPQNKDKTAKQAAPAAPAPAPAAAAPAESTEAEELADQEELVAVIAAAIAASEGTSPEGFRVRSIKRLRSNKWR